MTRQSKGRGSTRKKRSETFTAHSKSGNSPEDQTPENLYANFGPFEVGLLQKICLKLK